MHIGAKLGLIGGSGNPWNIANLTYSGSEFTLTQGEYGLGIQFSADGTKMYILWSGATDYIYQYTLSTAWDIATAVYSNKRYNATQGTNPQAFQMSVDGTKMYVVDVTSDTVFQYTLSTAWDISTASYASKSVSVAANETAPNCLAFSLDGTKMYVAGNVNDRIYQYTLSTAWDVSTATYASKSYQYNTDNPIVIAIGDSGRKLYMGGQTLRQFTMSTPYDISTATYDNISHTFTTDPSPFSTNNYVFKPDGTTLFCGNTTKIRKYNL